MHCRAETPDAPRIAKRSSNLMLFTNDRTLYYDADVIIKQNTLLMYDI